MALHAQGDLSAAEKQYAAVVPFVQHAGLYVGYAGLLAAVGRPAQAERWARRTAALYPDLPAAAALAGGIAQQAERWEEAEKWLGRRLRLGGDVAATHAGLGVVMTRQGKIAEGIAHCAAAARLDPHQADYRFNLAVALERADRFAEASARHKQALALRPDHEGALENGALDATRLGAAATAAGLYDRWSKLRPESTDIRFLRGGMRLAAGDWRGGWADMEARLEENETGPPRPRPTTPLWRGEPLPGGRLLVTAEQGQGDVLLFARFLPEIAARVDKVIFAVYAGLTRLFADCGPKVETVLFRAGMGADAWLPVGSAPYVLGMTPEALPRAPYIRADADLTAAWRARLPADGAKKYGAKKYGVVWAGNPAYRHDRLRSPGLAVMRPLLDDAAATPVVLQAGPGRSDIKAAGLPAHAADVGDQLTDYADTAAVIADLDLVISSDTSTAHLAAAMGKETWVLTSRHADWRWAEDAAGKSLWHPTARLFRQKTPGDWTGAVEDVRRALAQRYGAERR